MANLLGRYLQRNARQELVDSFEGNETPRQGSQLLYTDVEWRRPSPFTVEVLWWVDTFVFSHIQLNSYSAKDFGNR